MRLFSPRSEERKRTLLRKRAEYAQQASASAAAIGYGSNGYWPEAEAGGMVFTTGSVGLAASALRPRF